MAFARWDPIRDLLVIQQRLDRFAPGPGGWNPPVDLLETPDAYVVMAELPGVELVADPAGLSPLLARGHICALPLAAGGGTRIKILEAAAWGLPVVATALAAEGQEFWDGDEIMIAETDQAIARAVVALLAEPERLERQRRLAHEKVMLLYGPSAIENAVRRGFGLRGPAR